MAQLRLTLVTRICCSVVAALGLLVLQPSACAETPAGAAALYRSLRDVGLDASQVYRVRDAGFDREDIHYNLNDGWLIFGERIAGHITSAFFVGDGEVLIIPPNLRERSSLALFLGTRLLEEQFTSAYFRFYDDHFPDELAPYLRKDENADLLAKSADTAKQLAHSDALRLLLAFENSPDSRRFLHARMAGTKSGAFEIAYDEAASEQIAAAQVARSKEGFPFYNVWTSFASKPHAGEEASATAGAELLPKAFRVRAKINPPETLEAEADVDVEVLRSQVRAVLFELSRNLRVSSVTLDGKPVEFLQNEAIEGSRIDRDGNDYVAVVLPEPRRAGERLTLHFAYSGQVLSDAGNGLLYVGARGSWYPNLGLSMASFNLDFTYPEQWTLVATGTRTSFSHEGTQQRAHWTSDRPIPVAGFNLGHYQENEGRAGKVEVAAYSAPGVERAFPQVTQTITTPSLNPRRHGEMQAAQVTLPKPRPVGEGVVAQGVAAVQGLSAILGPYPYSSLSLTQIPGNASQGWPGLVYLSTFAFVPSAQRDDPTKFDTVLFDRLMVPHEIAHQWWGDSVYWSTYHDQWISEAMANYSAMLSFEQDDPADVKTILDYYRQVLAHKEPEGRANFEAGPVTLGSRLNSSEFPQGFNMIAYGRGTWLIHMLREFFRDGTGNDQLFLSVLRSIQSEYSGKQFSTGDLQRAFERVLPKSLYYEGKPSLAWFFDGWVNGTAMPRYQLASVHIARTGTALRATGKLIQKDMPQELITAVPIYAELVGGERQFVARVFADGTETPFTLKLPAGTKKVIVDPYATILTGM